MADEVVTPFSAGTSIGSGTVKTGTTVSFTSTIAVPTNSVVVVCASSNPGTALANSVSFGGITFTRQVSQANGNAYAAIFTGLYTGAGIASGTTLTVTYSAATAGAVAALYVSGVDTTTPVDTTVTASATGSSAAPSVQMAAAPAIPNSFVIGWVSTNGPQGDGFTQATNWAVPPVRIGTVGGNFATNETGTGGSITTSARISYNPTLGTSRVWVASVIAIRPYTGPVIGTLNLTQKGDLANVTNWTALTHTAQAAAGPVNTTLTAINTTGANFIALSFSMYNASYTVPLAISDNKGNTYYVCGTPATNTAEILTQLHYCPAPNVGPGHTFTVTNPNGQDTNSVLCAAAFAGPSDYAYDQGSNGPAGTTTASTGAITPTSDNQLLITSVGAGASGATITTVSGGFIKTDSINFGAGVNEAGGLAYLIQPSAGIANPTWTTPAATRSIAKIASFKGLVNYVPPPPVTYGALNIVEPPDTLAATGDVPFTLVTGDLNVLETSDTTDLRGGPVVVGTLSVNEPPDTIVAVGGPRASGTLNQQQVDQILAATGTVVVRGTLSVPQAAQTLTAAGAPAIGGILNVVEILDTIASTGSASVAGALSQLEALDTLTTTGTVRVGGDLNQPQVPHTLAATASPRVGGALNVVQAPQTLVAAGGPVARGTLAIPQAAQTLAAAGALSTTATLTLPQAAQTLVANGTVLSGIGGSLNLSQASQTLVAAGNVPVVVTGTLNLPQAPQTVVARAGPVAEAVLNQLQANQTIVSVGGARVTGILNLPQQAQAFVANALVTVRGTLDQPQANQTIAATGSIISGISGALNLTQAPQTLAATGTVPLVTIGNLNLPQASQTLVATGVIISGVSGNLSVLQASQTLAATGTALPGVSGTLNVTQEVNTVTVTGRVTVGGRLVVTQANHSISAAGYTVVYGGLTVTTSQTLFATGRVTVAGDLDLVQADQTLRATGGLGSVWMPGVPGTIPGVPHDRMTSESSDRMVVVGDSDRHRVAPGSVVAEMSRQSSTPGHTRLVRAPPLGRVA